MFINHIKTSWNMKNNYEFMLCKIQKKNLWYTPKKVIKNYNDENVSFGIASSHVILELPSTHSKHTSLVLAFHFVYLYKKGNALKPQYSEQVCQTLFVHYIE